MNYLVKFLVTGLILLNGSVLFALSDAEYNRLKSTDYNFAEAEARLSSVWKNLNSNFKKQILSEQRRWVKTDRDQEALELMSTGVSYAEAYSIVTDNRCDYLLTISGQLRSKDLESAPDFPSDYDSNPDDFFSD